MEDKKFLKLNDIEAYKIAFKLINYVWNLDVTIMQKIRWENNWIGMKNPV